MMHYIMVQYLITVTGDVYITFSANSMKEKAKINNISVDTSIKKVNLYLQSKVTL